MRLIFLYVCVEAFKAWMKDYCCVIYWRFVKFRVIFVKLCLRGVDVNLDIILYSLLIGIIFLSSLSNAIFSSFK